MWIIIKSVLALVGIGLLFYALYCFGKGLDEENKRRRGL